MSTEAPAKLKSPRLEPNGTPVVLGPVETEQMRGVCRAVEKVLEEATETEGGSERPTFDQLRKLAFVCGPFQQKSLVA